MPYDDLEDSIRAHQKGHRKADSSALINEAIERERALKAADYAAPVESVNQYHEDPEGRSYEKGLPVDAARMAHLGLTSVLPATKVRDQEKFNAFLTCLYDPDFKHRFPTYSDMARHFGVSPGTIKAWLLSEEVGKALEAAVSHEARLMMPEVLRSVKLRAVATGDPHAAEYIRKVAKLGTAETDVAKSFEKTLRQIAAERASVAQKGGVPRIARVVEAEVLAEEPEAEGTDPLDS